MRYRFAGFELDSDAYKLCHGERELHLQPLVFDVLHYLIQHRDRIVAKEELRDALWADGTGNDAAVTWSISHVRRALEQSRFQKTPIETIHGRGYRFAAELKILDTPPPAAPAHRPATAGERQLPFVGRTEIMSQLHAQLSAAEHGAGSVSVLVGEPGIGKTRCASELAAVARSRGFLVLNAQSAAGIGEPVFRAWQEILRGLMQFEQRLREPASVLLPRLTAAFDGAFSIDAGSTTRGTQVAVSASRVRVFDAVVRLLVEAARLVPLCLLFDDLHHADAGSIELLSFAAPELVLSRCMVLGARREHAAPHNARALAELALRGAHLPLTYLTHADISRYIAELDGAEPPPSLSDAVLAATGGNPLLVQETALSLLADRAAGTLHTVSPAAIRPSELARDVLRAPLSALDPAQRSLLQTASVLGEAFELTLLERVTGLEIETLLDRLESARELGLVIGDAPNRYRFRHGLIRTVLYDDASEADRIAVHRRAAELLARAADRSQRRSEIAVHYYRSLAAGDAPAVTRAAIAAGAAAEDVHAFADAATFYQWGLEAQALQVGLDPREHAELLVSHGRAQRLAGREDDARRTLEPAIQLASKHGFADLLLKAADILRPTHAHSMVPDLLTLSALEQALQTAPPDAHAQRIQALSQLACLWPISFDIERSKETSALALALAREHSAQLETAGPLASFEGVERRNVLLEALCARLFSLSGPDDTEALFAVCDEILSVDQSRTHMSWRAHISRYTALVGRGELRAARNALEAAGRLSQELHLAEARWHYERHRAQGLIGEGRFSEARSACKALVAKSTRLGLGYGPELMKLVRGAVEWEQRGGLAMRPHVDLWDQKAQLQALPCVHAFAARLAGEAGVLESAQRAFNRLAPRDFADVPREHSYLLILANAAIAAIALGDTARSNVLYELLAPYPERNTVDLALIQHGSVARYLALLAAATGRDARAVEHFEGALAMNARMPHLPQLACTQYDYARWLSQRGDVASRDRARSVAEDCRELAQQLEMNWLDGALTELQL